MEVMENLSLIVSCWVMPDRHDFVEIMTMGLLARVVLKYKV
jgi:hypothetical protein